MAEISVFEEVLFVYILATSALFVVSSALWLGKDALKNEKVGYIYKPLWFLSFLIPLYGFFGAYIYYHLYKMKDWREKEWN